MNVMLEFNWSYYNVICEVTETVLKNLWVILSQTTRTKENMWLVCFAGAYLHLKSEALEDQLFAMASVIVDLTVSL